MTATGQTLPFRFNHALNLLLFIFYSTSYTTTLINAATISNSFAFSPDLLYQPLDKNHVFLFTPQSTFTLTILLSNPHPSSDTTTNNDDDQPPNATTTTTTTTPPSPSPSPTPQPTPSLKEQQKDIASLKLRLAFCQPPNLIRHPSYFLLSKPSILKDVPPKNFCDQYYKEGLQPPVLGEQTGFNYTCRVFNIVGNKFHKVVREQDWGRNTVGVIKCKNGGGNRGWSYKGEIRSAGVGLGDGGRFLDRDEIILVLSIWIFQALYFVAFAVVGSLLIVVSLKRKGVEQEGTNRMRGCIGVGLGLKVVNLGFLMTFWSILWKHGDRKLALINLRVPSLVLSDLSLSLLAILAAQGIGIFTMTFTSTVINVLLIVAVVVTMASQFIAALTFGLITSSSSTVTISFYYISSISLIFFTTLRSLLSKSSLAHYQNVLLSHHINPTSTPFSLRKTYFTYLPFFVAILFMVKPSLIMAVDRFADYPRAWLLFNGTELIDWVFLVGLGVVFVVPRFGLLFRKVVFDRRGFRERWEGSGVEEREGELRDWTPDMVFPPMVGFERISEGVVVGGDGGGSGSGIDGGMEYGRFERDGEDEGGVSLREGCKIIVENAGGDGQQNLGIAIPVERLSVGGGGNESGTANTTADDESRGADLRSVKRGGGALDGAQSVSGESEDGIIQPSSVGKG